MSAKSFNSKIEIVINALKKAGYDPYDQLYGYVSTGEAAYITRQDNARDIVTGMDKDDLREYLKQIKELYGK